MRQKGIALALLIAALWTTFSVQAQPTVTAEDYARAERFLAFNTVPLVFGLSVNPNWLPDGRFWYRNAIPGGAEFILVDPAAGTRARAFDHVRLAEVLGTATASTYEALQLPFSQFDLSDNTLGFDLLSKRWACDLSTYTCQSEGPAQSRRRDVNSVPSPDGQKAAFIRNHNLWVRDLATQEEKPLTTDGVEDFGYATNNAGWIRSDTPILLWSPDSRKIATFQHDGRGVGEMHLVSTTVGHPRLTSWKYPLPGDSLIFRIHRVIIDVESQKMVRLQMPPDAHRGTMTDHIEGPDGELGDAEWSADASQLAFVSSSRDHKEATLRVADAETGVVRDVLKEVTGTYFESGVDMINWHVLFDSNEVIWFSERDNWGHLYLYNLENGQLKNQITRGQWAVQQLRWIDRANRVLYFTAGGREAGDPYFERFYRINFDGNDLQLLTPEEANHRITLAPSGQHFIDSHSTPVQPSITVLRDQRGRVVVELERGDISQLVAAGWQPPVPFQVKARDGQTDLYGLMYKPTHFDEAKTYPILNYLYPGPQSGSVGTRSFAPSRGDKQAVAELGFIVVEVDAMGTPGRSKSFHDAYYGNMGDNGLPDQIAAIKELGSRHPWMDLDRVGIWGHSGGGFASAGAILRYPDFYKVAVSSAGNHDNRNYEDDWGEKWHGLLQTQPDGTTNYDSQANHLLAGNLQGKLLLAHGMMDDNVPPSNTLLLVEALIAANKDFDLVVIPNGRHGFGRPGSTYWMRRRWDYFVRHLLHTEPPKEYLIGGGR